MDAILGISGMLLVLVGFICLIVFGIILIVKAAKKKPKKSMIIATAISGGTFIIGIILLTVGIGISSWNNDNISDKQSHSNSISATKESDKQSSTKITNKKVPEDLLKLDKKLSGKSGWKKIDDLKVTKDKVSGGYTYIVNLKENTSQTEIVNAILNENATRVEKYFYTGSKISTAIDLLSVLGIYRKDLADQLVKANNKSNKHYEINDYQINLKIDPDLGDMAYTLTIEK